MKIKKLEDYQLEELKNNKLLINKYNLSLKYNYEILPYWKALYVDLDFQLLSFQDFLERKDRLSERIKDMYPVLNDYITYDEWIKDNGTIICDIENGTYYLLSL